MLEPRLDILPPPQRRLWDELDQTPPDFVLYGGTALALRLGHRQSLDFDFFSTLPFTPSTLYVDIPYLKGAALIQSAPNTLTCRVNRDGDVLVSFFGGLSIGQVEPPETAQGSHIRVASLLDLAATKVKVILDRASYKDYADIDAMIQAGVDLARALAAARLVYGTSFDPLLSLKALAYFEDGDVSQLSAKAKARLTRVVRAVDLANLPDLSASEGSHHE